MKNTIKKITALMTGSLLALNLGAVGISAHAGNNVYVSQSSVNIDDYDVTLTDTTTTAVITTTAEIDYATNLNYDNSLMKVGETRKILVSHPVTGSTSPIKIDDIYDNVEVSYEEGTDAVYVTALAPGNAMVYIWGSGCSFGSYAEFTVIDDDTVIERLEFSILPDKIDYQLGEELDLTGLKLSGTFTSGTVHTTFYDQDAQSFVDKGFITIDTSRYNNTEYGAYSIIVNYDTRFISYCVYIEDPNTPPDYTVELEYDDKYLLVGETRAIRVINPAAEKAVIKSVSCSENLEYHYEEGSDIVYVTAVSGVTGYSSVTDNSWVFVEAEGCTFGESAEFCVIDPSCESMTVSADTENAKTVYQIGEKLDLSGIKIWGTYGGPGIHADIFGDQLQNCINKGIIKVDASEFDNTKPGTYTIYVHHGYATDEFTVTVVEPFTDPDLSKIPLSGTYKVKIEVRDIINSELVPNLECELFCLQTDEVVAKWNTGDDDVIIVENLKYSFDSVHSYNGNITYAIRITNLPEKYVFFYGKSRDYYGVSGFGLEEFAKGTNLTCIVYLEDTSDDAPDYPYVTGTTVNPIRTTLPTTTAPTTTTAKTTTTTTTRNTDTTSSTETTGALVVTMWGDTNRDNMVNLADAVLIMQHKANPKKYSMDMRGAVNGDVADNGDGLTNKDALTIQQFLLGTRKTLNPNAR